MTDGGGMIERVARAICGKNCDMPKCSCQPSADSKEVCRKMSIAMARRAIEAMQTGECICPKCGLRHGIESQEGPDF